MSGASRVRLSARRAVLEAGEYVSPDDLAGPAEALQPGDAVLIRLGSTLAGGIPPDGTGNKHGTWLGIHPASVELLAKRDISVLATDSSDQSFLRPTSISAVRQRIRCALPFMAFTFCITWIWRALPKLAWN